MGLLKTASLKVARNSEGQPVAGAKRLVYDHGTGTLSQLFADPDLTVPIPNPMVSSQTGQFQSCFLVDGAYRVVISDVKNRVLNEQSAVLITSSNPTRFETLADLEADTLLSYAASPGRQEVAEGTRIPVATPHAVCVVASELATDAQVETVGGVKLYTSTEEERFSVNKTFAITKQTRTGLEGAVITQANGADLTEVAEVAVTNSGPARQARIDLHVDGNQGQNLPTTGILVSELKRGSNTARLSANACDIGVKLAGNVEYAQIDTHTEDCRIGVLVSSETGITPDELLLNVLSHDCDTFFQTSGALKTSGSVNFGCERAASWGAVFEQGWWDLRGILRSVGRGTGGGLKLDGARLRGNVKITGGSATNCAWGAEFISGTVESLQVNLDGDYVDGMLVRGGVEGSARLIIGSKPSGTVALRLGVAAQTPLDGFHIEGGSRLAAEAGQTVIDLANCQNCLIEPSHLFGHIIIGADSSSNTVIVPRRNAVTGVTIANNATAPTNKVLYRGSYSLAELDALNGGNPFVGMEVESCGAWNGARGHFDGQDWVAENGYLTSGKATISASATQGLKAHGIPHHPGDYALSVYPANQAAAHANWWADVATTYVVLNTDTAAASDLEFNWVLRKAG